MTISTQRPLPENIQEIQREMRKHAKGYGLDFFDTIFEMVDYEEMSMMAAYTGFPTRYPHWRFGAQFDELMKGYSYGLQKIYEMVINTDPCYAYLLSNNEMVDQKLVVAHVYGHCDFFKNNAWFSKTNRRMLDQMANNAARVNKYIDKYGYEVVERYIDACLSLEDLIDPYSVYKDGGFADPDEKKDDEDGPDGSGKFAAKQYMDPFINPPELIKKERERKAKEAAEREASRRFPENPERDVLLFLMQHAPLQDWQRDVLSIIRDEAYYFAPQGMTKIMNEGWASYWHSTIMTNHGLNDADFICYADHHSGTMAMSPNRLNPYKIGIELFRDIEERWDNGKFGTEWDSCDDMRERENWHRDTGQGREKIFEVRKVHNDLTFIDTFLTADFCRKHKMFSFAYNDSSEHYEIASREFDAIKQQLLGALTNHSRPFIRVIDGNHKNRGELYLRHQYQGVELKQDYAQATLQNLVTLWLRPVHIETMVNDEPTVLSFDGKSHEENPK